MNQYSYADVEIRILERQAEGYPVEITVNHEEEFPRGYLSPDLLPWVPQSSSEADGERLFDWLLADDQLKVAWAELRGRYPQRRIRLRLDADIPELHAIPWETLRDPSDGPVVHHLAAATTTPFSRYLAGKWQAGSPILKRPLKILVAVANPADLADYDLAAIDPAEELAVLERATANLAVELVPVPEPCTLAAIEQGLAGGCHILHFVGHGIFSQRRDQAQLYLADDDNQVALISETEFAEMMARQLANVDAQLDDKLRLVFLASCQTATRSSSDAFRGAAPALIQAGVPAVLAMQDLVPIETAQAFSQIFYQQLLQHGLVDVASNEARSALISSDLPGAAIPVLFMRLRSGQLLGQRGRISSESEDLFWPFLLERIDLGQCTPFLGPRVNEGLLPDLAEVAAKLGEKYGYPLSNVSDWVKVAQFIAVNDPALLKQEYLRLMQRSLFSYLGLKPGPDEKKRFRRAGFSETADALNWAEKVLLIHENEIHHLLADLELPLYVTTNFDSFMVRALQQKGFAARQAGPRWHPQAGSPQYVLTPKPSPEAPVVFHLNGYEGDEEQQQHMVLSEDDYLRHFVRLSRDQEQVLPMNLLESLAQNSFLFLGYRLDDWEFRLILQALLSSIAQTTGGRKVHVGVQLEEEDVQHAEKAMDYLQRYLGRYNIDIYWGTPQQFVAELHAHWMKYISEVDDDW